MGRYDNLVEQIKTIDTEVVKDWNKNTDPAMKILEEQKVYIWIRLFLKEEADVEVGDEIFMTYKPSGEKLSTIFVCYGKTDLGKAKVIEIKAFSSRTKNIVALHKVNEYLSSFDNDNTISLSMHGSGGACVIVRHVSEGASCPH